MYIYNQHILLLLAIPNNRIYYFPFYSCLELGVYKRKNIFKILLIVCTRILLGREFSIGNILVSDDSKTSEERSAALFIRR